MKRGKWGGTVSFAILLSWALFSGCGGGTVVAGGGTGGTGISVGSITGFGSIFVNGIEFDDTGAVVVIDNTAGHTPEELRLGMRVQISGNFDYLAGSGTADRIEVLTEVRGRLDDDGVDLATDRIFVMGREVLVLSSAFFDNVTGLAALEDLLSDELHPEVEVQGAPDDLGRIYATYIRKRADDIGVGQDVAVRGTVSGLSGTSFDLDGTTVNFSLLGTIPELQDGSFVEVRGTFSPGPPPTIDASLVKIESSDLGDDGDEVEVEGVVQGGAVPFFAISGPNGPVPVTTDDRTIYDGGSPADVVPGVRVEVEGMLLGGGIVAREVEFK